MVTRLTDATSAAAALPAVPSTARGAAELWKRGSDRVAIMLEPSSSSEEDEDGDGVEETDGLAGAHGGIVSTSSAPGTRKELMSRDAMQRKVQMAKAHRAAGGGGGNSPKAAPDAAGPRLTARPRRFAAGRART